MMPGWTMGTEAWVWMGAWALVMVLVVWLLVREPHREAQVDPDAILRDRFARGEISEDEFRQASEALASGLPIERRSGVHHPATGPAAQGQEGRND